MEKIRNLTPHPINILDEEGNNIRTIAPDVEKENLPRLVEDVEKVGEVDGIPILRKTYGRCENLPARQEGIYLIVSGLIATAMKRNDLLVPNTVRNEKGQIIGAASLSVVV
jgi:hypothetical protein